MDRRSYEEVSFRVSGINHLSWIVEFKRGDEDLYPRVRVGEQPGVYDNERVRFEILRQFGCFSTGQPPRLEYLPYFRRTPALMDVHPGAAPA